MLTQRNTIAKIYVDLSHTGAVGENIKFIHNTCCPNCNKCANTALHFVAKVASSDFEYDFVKASDFYHVNLETFFKLLK